MRMGACSPAGKALRSKARRLQGASRLLGGTAFTRLPAERLIMLGSLHSSVFQDS